MKIYTHSVATDIVEVFEQVLDRYNIVVPSPEDDQREPGNDAKLYGSVYGQLVDTVECVLIDICKRAKSGEEIITGVFE